MESARVLQRRAGGCAAEVREGGRTTEHRVLFPPERVDSRDVPEPDGQAFVGELIEFLLEGLPVTALPHGIDPDGIENEHRDFLPEIGVARVRDGLPDR